MKSKKSTANNLASKLAAYTTVAAGAVAMANPAAAQVSFNDIPDATLPMLVGGAVYGFDMDGDGTNDIQFFGFQESAVYMGVPYTYTLGYVYAPSTLGQNEIIGNLTPFGSTNFATPTNLNAGVSISGASAFQDSSRHLLNLGLDGQSALGNFGLTNCSFIGLKFHKAGGAVHYGYLVLDTDLARPAADGGPELTIKAFAWEQTANTAITAVGPITPVLDVNADVIGSAGTPADVRYTFDADCDDSGVSEHRVMIVKSTAATAFDSTAAAGVASGNYTVVTPNGGPYSGFFAAGAVDTDGDAIALGTSYDVFVFSAGGSANRLSESDDFILPVPFTANTNGLLLTDIADNADGRDLRLTFNKAADETLVVEYIAIILKSAQADTATLNFLGGLPTSAYNTVAKTGSNLTYTFGAGSVDADGDPITYGVAYKVLVGTQGDASTGDQVNLSSPASNEVTLNTAPLATGASSVVASDVGNAGNGADLNVTFDKAADETNVQEYSVVVLPSAVADTAGLAYLNGLPGGNFTNVSPNGSNLTVNFLPTSVDGLGTQIDTAVAYKALVITKGTAATGGVRILSSASNSVTLDAPIVGIAAVDAIEGVDMYSFADVISLTVKNEAVVGETIRVTNLAGQEVYNGTIKAGIQTINMSHVTSGMYIAIIEANGELLSKKVFIGK